MKVRILFFGFASDIAHQTEMTVENIQTLAELKNTIFAQYPALNNPKFQIAVNKSICKTDCSLHDGDEIAFLPPFAGG